MISDELMRDFLKLVTEKLEKADEITPRGAEDYVITPKDIVTDFRLFADEMYEGTAEEEDADSLVIAFRNGQRFRVIVHEIKLALVD